MNDLDILYKLQEDPDSYWVLYDLCLENGWALAHDLFLQPVRCCCNLCLPCSMNTLTSSHTASLPRSYLNCIFKLSKCNILSRSHAHRAQFNYNLLYNLSIDPDGYWIAYDYKIETGSADIDTFIIPWVLFGYGGGYNWTRSDPHNPLDRSRAGYFHRSSSDDDVFSTAGIGNT
jgi:hypothetical protein